MGIVTSLSAVIFHDFLDMQQVANKDELFAALRACEHRRPPCQQVNAVSAPQIQNFSDEDDKNRRKRRKFQFEVTFF